MLPSIRSLTQQEDGLGEVSDVAIQQQQRKDTLPSMMHMKSTSVHDNHAGQGLTHQPVAHQQQEWNDFPPVALYTPGFVASSTPKKISTKTVKPESLSDSSNSQQGHETLKPIPTVSTHQQPFNGLVASPSLSFEANQARMACVHCRKSHRKCDKLLPCGECKRRGIPDECMYYEPKKRGPKIKACDAEETTPNNSPNHHSNPQQTTMNQQPLKKRKTIEIENTAQSRIIPNTPHTEPEQPRSHQYGVQPLPIEQPDSIFSRNENDRRNYLFQLLAQRYGDKSFETERPNSTLFELIYLFIRQNLLAFICDNIDSHHSTILQAMLKDHIIPNMLRKLQLDPIFSSLYYALEAIFFKYHTFLNQKYADENKYIFLTESNKSMIKCKKELVKLLAADTMDYDLIMTCMWSASILLMLDSNSDVVHTLLDSYLRMMYKILERDPSQDHTIYWLLFTKYSILSKMLANDFRSNLKVTVSRIFGLTFILSKTSLYKSLFSGEFDELNGTIFKFNNITEAHIVNYGTVLKELECFIPRTITECSTMLKQVNQKAVASNSSDIILWQFLVRYLKLRSGNDGGMSTSEMTRSIVEAFLELVHSGSSPFIIALSSKLIMEVATLEGSDHKVFADSTSAILDSIERRNLRGPLQVFFNGYDCVEFWKSLKQ